MGVCIQKRGEMYRLPWGFGLELLFKTRKVRSYWRLLTNVHSCHFCLEMIFCKECIMRKNRIKKYIPMSQS